jgi:hypothetical protein
MMGEAEKKAKRGNQKKPNMSDKEKEKVEEKISTEEKDIDKNPDIEDPRLYSPLQEPDRPAPSERATDEDEGIEATESGDSKD